MKKYLWLLAVPVAISVLACAAPSPSERKAGGVSAEPIAPTASNAVVQEQLVVATSDPVVAPTTSPAGPFVFFMDGQYEVGNSAGQVKPGKYKATVPHDSWGCYWARLKNFDGAFDGIIANGLGSADEPVIVTIKPTDKGFKTNGCGMWRLS